MIRITSGRLKGKKLLSMDQDIEIRPTLSKTRAAIFNSIQSRWNIHDFSVYDLFAGTGTLGIEAYSRGAKHVVFVDKDKKSFAFLKKNLNYLDIAKDCDLFCADALNWIKIHHWTAEPKLLLLDPPYNSPVLQEIIDFLATGEIPLSDSVVVIERSVKTSINFPDGLQPFRQKTFGLTQLDFLEFEKSNYN